MLRKIYLIPLLIIFFIVLFIIIIGEFTPVLSFDTNSYEPEARQILYDYKYNEISNFLSEKEYIEEFKREFTSDCVHAFSYDLNDDGTKEIIGYALSRHTIGSQGVTGLVILQKTGNSYEDISRTLFNPQMADIVILRNKTNGYNKIFLENKYVIKYENKVKYYKWAYTLDMIKYIRAHLS